jgi:hypothetical protein
MLRQVILLLGLLCLSQSIFDIISFGAVPHSDTVPDQFKNQKALHDAIVAANLS